MLNNLSFEVTFPTGKSFSGEHNFSTGMTVVTGRNERGKSLRVELIRFALFGSDALRGKAEDYRRMKVALTFTVRDEQYTVKRSASKATLERGGEALASGTRPVNEKIVEIFGYGLDVFDVANACTQGQIEALGNMRPTARRAMIDQTVGLNKLDAAAEWCGERRKEHNLAADTIEASIVELPKPVQPDGYVRSTTLTAAVDEASEQVAELNRIRGWLQNEPKDPGPRPVSPSTVPIETLREQNAQRAALIAERTALQKERERMTPPSPMSMEQIEAMLKQHDLAAAYQKAENDFRALPQKPAYTSDELDAIEQDIQVAAKQKRRANLLEEGHICCPNCDHKWPVAADEIDELGELPEAIVVPKLTAAQVAKNRRDLANYAGAAPDMERLTKLLAHPVDTPTISRESLLKHQSSLVGKLRWIEITERLPELDREIADIPDHTKTIQAVENYQRVFANWDAQHIARLNWLVDAESYRDRMTKLGDCEAYLTRLQTKLREATAYETALQNYEASSAQVAELRATVSKERGKAKEFEKAKDALRELKLKIKQHLIPSLSSVASMLLAQMTGGEHVMMTIDDEFDSIIVDGQEIDTLAGSAKAVSNLALRLGLGQVLTNRVFSVFMGDELDAAMDQERAGFTAECLRNLTKTIAQVVVVSHKKLEADHHIEV